MDINEAIEGGMSWRRFAALLSGLSAESRWQLSLQHDSAKPRVLEGASADAWIKSRAH